MQKMRKISSVFLIVAILASLAGCTAAQIPSQTSTETLGSSVTLTDSTTNTTQGYIPSQSTATQPTAPTTQLPTPTMQPTTPPTPTMQPTTLPAPTTQPTTPPAPTTQPTTPPTSTTQPTTPTTQPTLPVTHPTTPATKPVTPTTQPTVPPTQPPDVPAIPNRITVEAPGILVKSSKNAVIDYSNTKDGYVMVCYTGATEKKLKAQVKGPTTTYTYNLTPEKWAAFPLSDENGEYKITIYQNTTGTKYASLLSATVSVVMEDEFAPFLRSNQYVDFDTAPKSVAKAAELTRGLTDPLKKVEAVYRFVVNGMAYDKELAATVKSGYLPDLDSVLEKMKGICFDYAALMTGMLRSQGVPTKLVVGYAGTTYHAWISVWSEKTGWIEGVVFFDGTNWQRMDPTFASSGGSSSDIMNYIGNGSNYTAKYFY